MTDLATSPVMAFDVNAIDEPSRECVVTFGEQRASATLKWNGRAVTVDVPTAVLAGPTDEGVALDTNLLLGSGLGQPSVLRAIQQMQAQWQAWQNHPGRYGLVPRDGISITADKIPVRAWIAPETVDEQLPGRPCVEYVEGVWTLTIESHSYIPPLLTAAWDDTDAMVTLCELALDPEACEIQAALLAPQEWAAHIEKRTLEMRKIEREEQFQASLAEMRNDTRLGASVSTRKVAAALRQAMPAIRVARGLRCYGKTTLTHVDLPMCGAEFIRIGEILNLDGFTLLDLRERQQVMQEVRKALEPIGYQALLTKRGRILIGRSQSFMHDHLNTFVRLNDSTRELTL